MGLKRVVCISDTHSLHWGMVHQIPEGDILIHAGDITNYGSIEDVIDFCIFLDTVPIQHKVICGGNHDFCFENEQRNLALETLKKHGIHYLENNGIIVDSLNIYGSGWTPEFYNWAMMYPRNSEKAKLLWNNIPKNTDILITHGPVKGILDLCHYDKFNAGCELLLEKVQELGIPVHVCGHIHEDYGFRKVGKTTFINASTCSLRYKPINKPIVFDIDEKTKKIKIKGD